MRLRDPDGLKRRILEAATIGERIAELRLALGPKPAKALPRAAFARALTEALAREPAVAESTIQRWEERGVEPDVTALWVMARWAGVQLEEMAFGAHDPRGILDPGEDEEVPRPAPATRPLRRGGATG